MPSIGPLELVIVLAIVLVVFGPKRLPGLGRSLGSGMKEFKDSITGRHEDEDEDKDGEGLAAELEATKAEARSAGEAPRAANEVDAEPAEREAPGPRA